MDPPPLEPPTPPGFLPHHNHSQHESKHAMSAHLASRVRLKMLSLSNFLCLLFCLFAGIARASELQENRRLGGAEDVCRGFDSRTKAVRTEAELKDAIVCVNNRTWRAHRVEILEHVQLTGVFPGASRSGFVVKADAKVTIVGAKDKSSLT